MTTAAATLTGLLFVPVSINPRQIPSFPNLPLRAGQTPILFSTPLIARLFLVVPGQARAAVAGELLATGVAVGALQILIGSWRPRSENETPLTRMVMRVFPTVASCGCPVIAGATLLAHTGEACSGSCPARLLRSSSASSTPGSSVEILR